jgi:hypothetical protein
MYFKDSIIVERYYDAKTNSYYSLCRAPWWREACDRLTADGQ